MPLPEQEDGSGKKSPESTTTDVPAPTPRPGMRAEPRPMITWLDWPPPPPPSPPPPHPVMRAEPPPMITSTPSPPPRAQWPPPPPPPPPRPGMHDEPPPILRPRPEQEEGCGKTVLTESPGSTTSYVPCRKRRRSPASQQSPPSEGPASPEWSKRRAAAKTHEKEDEEEKEEEEEEEVSFAASSPIRRPYIPGRVIRFPNGTQVLREVDMATSMAFARAEDKYHAKRARQLELPTLRPQFESNCLTDDPKLLPIRESASKTVLCAAKFIVGLSSFVDDEPRWCSGLWIDWDDEQQIGIISTTAHLIRLEGQSSDQWLCQDEYVANPEITVHMRGGDTAKGELLYCQRHYNIVFVGVKLNRDVVHLSDFKYEVKSSQDVFELGRDKSTKLMISHGRIRYENPTLFERHHYLYIQNGAKFDRERKYENGGPVIDLDGYVVGMISNSTRGSFIPSSILKHCYFLWKELRCIRRPQFGLKLSAISLLDPVFVEDLSIECNIVEGLIDEEVSEGSVAEQCGIRVGDVIEYLDGTRISTTVELEKMLLCISEQIGFRSKGEAVLQSQVDVVLQVYHPRIHRRRMISLKVNAVDDAEKVVTASYPVTAGEGMFA